MYWNMTVEEALEFFENMPSIRRKIADARMMWGFLISGWDSHLPQLSGGEAQRIKLATELSKQKHREDHVYSG